MSKYAFQPVTPADFDRLAVWFSAPHVARWWGEADGELQEIRTHMTSASVRPFVILMDGRPIGYIQSYDIHGEDDHPYRDQPSGTRGIDQFIGEADLIGRGHGARIVDAFARRLFGEGAPRVAIDPDPANTAAIRAYIKAGFHIVGPRTSIYGPALMMARNANHQKSTT